MQLVDFRFAKPMNDERTFTVCGMADFLAPEIIQGQGHGLASDWYATQFPTWTRLLLLYRIECYARDW